MRSIFKLFIFSLVLAGCNEPAQVVLSCQGIGRAEFLREQVHIEAGRIEVNGVYLINVPCVIAPVVKETPAESEPKK